MSSRRLVLAAAVIACIGCGADTSTTTFTGKKSLPPLTPAVTASHHTVVDGAGRLALQVTASLRNPSGSVIIRIHVGAQCPLRVRIFPDPTGEFMGSLSGADGCPLSSATMDLAPGDSVVLEHTVSADSLASMAAGTYGIMVAVTTDSSITGVWGGAFTLPLTTPH